MPVKRSNTQYIMSPMHQDKKSIFVMGQSYNDNWATKPGTKHIQVNGYANGWVIPSGTTKLTIEYRIQELFLYGCIISVTTFLASLVILVISRQKKAK
jgi:arabinofuranan 3-O-arabinosyltransferase